MNSFESEQQKLHHISEYFTETTSLTLFCSAELEFYIECPDNNAVFFCQNTLWKSLTDNGLSISPITQEEGDGQFEFSFTKQTNAVTLAQNIVNAKSIINESASSHHKAAYQDAKPYQDQPGNGMQINISVHDKKGTNLFSKPYHSSGNEESVTMQNAISGLLKAMPESMKYFAPNAHSYNRYNSSFDTATTVSWGSNNRTVALRIPTSTHNNKHRHIEHRIPGMDANPFDVLGVIILAIQFGLEHQLIPNTPKIYGNANNKQYSAPPYQLQKLPSSHEESALIQSKIVEPFYK